MTDMSDPGEMGWTVCDGIKPTDSDFALLAPSVGKQGNKEDWAKHLAHVASIRALEPGNTSWEAVYEQCGYADFTVPVMFVQMGASWFIYTQIKNPDPVDQFKARPCQTADQTKNVPSGNWVLAGR